MNHGPTLQTGSTGDDVRRLQRLFVMMKTLGPTEIDGDFGPKTDAAVRDFQSGAGLTADGIVGPLTWAKLPADPNTPGRSARARTARWSRRCSGRCARSAARARRPTPARPTAPSARRPRRR